MAQGKIVVMYPTWGEARPFMLGPGGGAVEVWRCGIGPAECAARTAALLVARRPDFVLLAGIAGARPRSGLSKGDTVTVSREYAVDVGTLRGDRFVALPVDGNAAFVPERGLGYGRRRGDSSACRQSGRDREYGGGGLLRRVRCAGSEVRRASLHIELRGRGAVRMAGCGGGRTACGGCAELRRGREDTALA